MEFAAHNGIRLSWVDQVSNGFTKFNNLLTFKECINQENPKDKELGTQAMDKVYQRAFLSIGLLQTRVESHESLKGLNQLYTKSNSTFILSPPTNETPDAVENILAFFEPIVNDPWHSRAWILQEAFSAGLRMNIILLWSPNVDIKGLPGTSRILSVMEIVVPLDVFCMLIDYVNSFLIRSLGTLPLAESLSKR